MQEFQRAATEVIENTRVDDGRGRPLDGGWMAHDQLFARSEGY
jgi:hypothetical protein